MLTVDKSSTVFMLPIVLLMQGHLPFLFCILSFLQQTSCLLWVSIQTLGDFIRRSMPAYIEIFWDKPSALGLSKGVSCTSSIDPYQHHFSSILMQEGASGQYQQTSDCWLESCIPLTLQWSLGTLVREIPPIWVTVSLLVCLHYILVVHDMVLSPECRCLLIGTCGWILWNSHVAPSKNQEFFKWLAELSLHLNNVFKRSYNWKTVTMKLQKEQCQ